MSGKLYTIFISLIVAIGGFLLGFDSAVISGALPYYSQSFGLEPGTMLLGFSVSSLILGAILGNIFAGYLADKFGRGKVLKSTALLFAVSAIGSALAFDITSFIVARVIGGAGVGMAILVAPMYIAEVAPRGMRGTLVTFNQLNIVLGISIAYFSNYFFQQTIADPDLKWRVMLGVEAIPAILYLGLLFFIPQSPRWLMQKGKNSEARAVLDKIHGHEQSIIEFDEINKNLNHEVTSAKAGWGDLFSARMKLVLVVGFGIAFFQQITGINAIFYYAPMIFEMAGGGRGSAFMQAAVLGVTNVVMTVVAMYLIDRLGRKPLLYVGATGITISLAIVSLSFFQARYVVTGETVNQVTAEARLSGASPGVLSKLGQLESMAGHEFDKELLFFDSLESTLGHETYNDYKDLILTHSIKVNSTWVLLGLILFVASFAISMGPVMWALLSEIFPNKLRGLAISIMGFWNSIVSFSVATVFPAQIDLMGSSATYLVYSAFGLLSLIFIWRFVPETKGKSLEEIEDKLVR